MGINLGELWNQGVEAVKKQIIPDGATQDKINKGITDTIASTFGSIPIVATAREKIIDAGKKEVVWSGFKSVETFFKQYGIWVLIGAGVLLIIMLRDKK